MTKNEDSETQWTGHDLHDLDGNKIGKIEDVRYGDVTGGLQWLVVETGMPGAKKLFVPAGEVRRSSERLSVPHTRERVKDAPRVDDPEVLTDAEESRLCRFYGLQHGSSVTEPAEGCSEIEDRRPGG